MHTIVIKSYEKPTKKVISLKNIKLKVTTHLKQHVLLKKTYIRHYK